ncbi:hypothetical protein LTR56_010492 [Elasticomyces elasticus]|nr:hypothetical protein LTR56_010492 [Elasticomyces elasticus]KAK3657908.1 hypothetical protein LTR22_009135 [Elasticomyces elasticus]KAK4917595.1 hypothetical protein LTR49_014549 [Elasticomyces elasticus]KAK5762815.1 hypothetical protein LTS12_007004 [Elasticomyces elasticus]
MVAYSAAQPGRVGRKPLNRSTNEADLNVPPPAYLGASTDIIEPPSYELSPLFPNYNSGDSKQQPQVNESELEAQQVRQAVVVAQDEARRASGQPVRLNRARRTCSCMLCLVILILLLGFILFMTGAYGDDGDDAKE